MEDIMNNIQLPWNWEAVSENPNLNSEIIEKYPNKPWSFRYIASNKFSKNTDVNNHNVPMEYSNELFHKAIKRTNIIKEELMRITWHPDRVFDWCMESDDIEN